MFNWLKTLFTVCFKSNPIRVVNTEFNAIKYTPMDGIDTRKFEGLMLHVYTCTAGRKTIGYGHNLQGGSDKNLIRLDLPKPLLLNGTRDLTKAEAESLFQLDYLDALNDVRKLCPRLDSMPKLIQLILGDLSFNMGLPTLSEFKNTLRAFNEGNWNEAADGLNASKWYRQTGNRGRAIVKALRNI